MTVRLSTWLGSINDEPPRIPQCYMHNIHRFRSELGFPFVTSAGDDKREAKKQLQQCCATKLRVQIEPRQVTVV